MWGKGESVAHPLVEVGRSRGSCHAGDRCSKARWWSAESITTEEERTLRYNPVVADYADRVHGNQAKQAMPRKKAETDRPT
jgi:hypothetical protein